MKEKRADNQKLRRKERVESRREVSHFEHQVSHFSTNIEKFQVWQQLEGCCQSFDFYNYLTYIIVASNLGTSLDKDCF